MSETTELIAQQILNGNINKRTWGDILYNVKVYGAIGDGVKDDTIAIQATIDYAISVGGKAVFFPHGTYKVTALTGLSSVVLFGDNASFVGITDTISQIGKPSSNLVYNVKDYGAIGDGTTDDTTDIQAAITTAKTVNGSVVFPPGTYLVTNLTITGNVSLFSYGGATIKQSAYVGNMISISGTGVKVSFDNITFDGNQSTQVSSSNNAIIDVEAAGSATDTFLFYAENCTFINQAYTSIYARGDLSSVGMEYFNINECEFYSGAEGSSSYDPRYLTLVDGGNFIVTNNVFDYLATPTGTGVVGVFVSTTDTATPFYSAATIANNVFRNTGRLATNAIGVIDLYTYGENVLIQGNKFYDSKYSPIKGKTNSRSVIIENNFMDGSGTAAGINLNPATFDTTRDNFQILNNIVRNMGSHGIVIDALTGDFANRVNVIGNIIDTCGGTGIQLNRVNNSVIQGNQINTATLQGINYINCSGEHIAQDNIIVTTSSFGIYADTGVTLAKFDISHNQLKQPNKYGIYVKTAKALTAIGNIIEDVVLNASQVGIAAGTITQATIIIGNQVYGQSSNWFVALDGINTLADIVEYGNSWNASQYYGTAAPTTGTWAVGDKVWQTTPAASGYIGFVCTVAGTPGTWKGFGLIQA